MFGSLAATSSLRLQVGPEATVTDLNILVG